MLPSQVPVAHTGALEITCDIFGENWPIKIRKAHPSIVTVGDVLDAIHVALDQPISLSEWNSFSDKQKHLISGAYGIRCEQAEDREAARRNGLFRIDCLMKHTWFAGLSVSLEKDFTCIMSIGRPR